MDMEKQLKAMAEPTRRKIIDLLKEDTLTAGEISELCGKTQSNISHHLNILKEAGLIQSDKQGNFIYYSLKDTQNDSKKEVEKLLNVKDKFFQELNTIIRNRKCEPVLGTDSHDVGTMYVMKDKKTLLAFDYSFLLHSFTLSFQIPTNVRSEKIEYQDSEKIQKVLNLFNELLCNILLDFENKEKNKHTLKDSIQDEVNKRFPNDDLFLTEDMHKKEVLFRFIEGWLEEYDQTLSEDERLLFAQECVDEISGFGILQKFMDDNSVSEIMVTGKDDVSVERKARLEKTDIVFRSEEELWELCRRIARFGGRRFDNACPECLVRFPNASIHMILNGISQKGIALTIRKWSGERLELDDMLRFGSISKDMADFLTQAVQSNANILITGGGSSGKTSFLNILGNLTPDDERIITIESIPELNIVKPYVVKLLTRRANAEGKGEFSYSDCILSTKYMRPERIFVDGIHDHAAFPLMDMIRNGHDGTITTVTGSSIEITLNRISNLVRSGYDYPSKFINNTIGESFDLIVELSRLRDGTRKVTKIVELLGYDHDTDKFIINPLFVWELQSVENRKLKGHFRYTGLPMTDMLSEKFERYGFNTPIKVTDKEFQDTQYIQSIEQQLPSFCLQLADAFKAGYVIRDAFQVLSEYAVKPIADELYLFCKQLDSGMTFIEVLTRFKERIPSQEVALFVDTILLTNECGSPLEPPLRKLGSALENRNAILSLLPPYKRKEELSSTDWQLLNLLDLTSISLPLCPSFEDTLIAVDRYQESFVSKEFCRYAREMETGKPVKDALNDLGKRLNDTSIHTLVSQLKQAFVFGTSIEKTLSNQSERMKSTLKANYQFKFNR